LTQQLAGTNNQQSGLNGVEAHKLVVTSLLNIGDGLSKNGSVVDALRAGKSDVATLAGGDKMEEYISSFIPQHLMKCHALTSAAELLSDGHFIGRRVAALGIVEATSRHVADLQELRRVGGSLTFPVAGSGKTAPETPNKLSATGASPQSPMAGGLFPRDNADDADGPSPASTKFDVNGIVRDGSRIIIEEVYRVANKPEGSRDALGVAMCLAAVGDGLLKSRQPRDAMLRLEESVGIYRGLLGPYHVNVSCFLIGAVFGQKKDGDL
jgi:hypothetical protein